MITSELTNTDIFIRIALSLIAGMVIGMERGSKSQPAGIRTHSVVCVAACLIMMTNEFVSYKFGTGDPTRLGAQLFRELVFSRNDPLSAEKKKLQANNCSRYWGLGRDRTRKLSVKEQF